MKILWNNSPNLSVWVSASRVNINIAGSRSAGVLTTKYYTKYYK